MEHFNQKNQSAIVASRSQPASIQPHSNTSGPYDLENEGESTGGGLLEYWRILRRNARVILSSSLAGLVLGFVIGIPMKPVFRAKTSLEVLTINDDFMNMKQANPTTTNDNGYDTSEEQTQAKLLEGSALIDRVMQRLDPNAPTRPIKPRMAKSGWRSWLHLSELVSSTPREKLLAKAADSLKVRPTTRTRVLELTVDSTDPQLASDFANTLTQEFMTQNMEARWSTTQRTSEWLKRELDDARNKLRISEDALQSYARGSGLIFTDETTNVATEKLQQLQQALSNAEADRIAKQSRFELAQHSPPDTLADVLNDSGLRETQSKISDLKRQIADLTAVFNPEYSKVRRLQAELESLQSSIGSSRTDILNRIKTDYEESLRKEKLLSSAYDRQAHEVSGQDEKAIQYNILKRDVDSNRQLYDVMLQEMKQASIASAMRASNVRVVDPAEIPDTAVSPNFKLNSVLGLFMGFFISIVSVTIRERADRTIQQPGDIKLWAQITELGVIPAASINAKALQYSKSNQAATQRRTFIQPGLSNLELATWETPTIVGEAFRSLLTSILFMSDGPTNSARVLVFTSANPADGKTTVASNLAIAAAEIRMKVLIIDADLRRPRMHSVFGLGNETGLVDLLRANSDVESTSDLICNTRVDNLYLLPAGPATHAASHLLYSPNWENLLNRLRKEFALIIVDTPPMLQMTDARVAARIADSVILVGRSSRTTRDSLIAARNRFEDDRIRVLGAVLNDWNPKNSPGGYYGYYRNDSYTIPYQGGSST